MSKKSVLEELAILRARGRTGVLSYFYLCASGNASEFVKGTTSQEVLLKNLRDSKACVWICPHAAKGTKDKNNYDMSIKIEESDSVVYPLKTISSYEVIETVIGDEVTALKSIGFNIEYRGYMQDFEIIDERNVNELERRIRDE